MSAKFRGVGAAPFFLSLSSAWESMLEGRDWGGGDAPTEAWFLGERTRLGVSQAALPRKDSKR